jgi:hypothetical protein
MLLLPGTRRYEVTVLREALAEVLLLLQQAMGPDRAGAADFAVLYGDGEMMGLSSIPVILKRAVRLRPRSPPYIFPCFSSPT